MEQQTYQPYHTYPQPPQPPPARQLRRLIRQDANRCSWALLCVVALMNLLQIMGFSFLGLLGVAPTGVGEYLGLSPVLYYLFNISVYLLAFAVPPLVYFALRHQRIDSFVPFGRVRPGVFLGVVLLGAGICFLANFPAQWVADLQRAGGFSADMPRMPMNDSPLVQALFFVSLAVVPPLVEEFLFRGMLLGALRRYGDAFAIMCSALLFALFHGNFTQITFAFICGLVMGFAVVRTGSLWAGVAIHFVNNAYSSTAEILQRNFPGDQMIIAMNLTFFAFIGAGLVAGVYLLLCHKGLFCLQRPEAGPLGRWEKLGAALANPGALLFLAYCLATAVSVMAGWLTLS